MQLNQSNYLQFREQIDWSRMPAVLTGKPKEVTDNAATKNWVNMGEQAQKATEHFFKLCSAMLAKDPTLLSAPAAPPEPSAAPAPDLPAATPPQPKAKRPRAKKEKAPKSEAGKLMTALPADVPKAAQVLAIATPVSFIKRYVALDRKVKTREQIVSLLHSLQKAITEGRITSRSPASAEIGKMQAELLSMFYNMDAQVHVLMDAKSLAHYMEIAKGEEVRTSVRLLKQFIQMTGKAADKKKAESLGKRLAIAYDTVPKEDAYRSELASAAKAVASYVSGETKAVGIPSATLHGLGTVASGTVAGLGAISSGENAIIQHLRQQRVSDFSEASLKRAFRNAPAPGLCVEIAKGLMRRGELTKATMLGPLVKKKPSGLDGVAGEPRVSADAITDLDVLDLKLSGHHASASLAGLGTVTTITQGIPARLERTVTTPPAFNDATETVSARDLAKMRFKTIGYNGRFKDVMGDPALGFHMMVYGPPFNGKSSFVIELCKDLAALGKGRIAYLALEEGISLSMQKKVLDRGADKVDGLEFKGAMPASFDGYCFVVIDSVSDRAISREKLREMFLTNPKTCFICIFHATKAGDARGGLDYSHDMDIILKIEGHKPLVEKNRFL